LEGRRTTGRQSTARQSTARQVTVHRKGKTRGENSRPGNFPSKQSVAGSPESGGKGSARK